MNDIATHNFVRADVMHGGVPDLLDDVDRRRVIPVPGGLARSLVTHKGGGEALCPPVLRRETARQVVDLELDLLRRGRHIARGGDGFSASWDVRRSLLVVGFISLRAPAGRPDRGRTR